MFQDRDRIKQQSPPTDYSSCIRSLLVTLQIIKKEWKQGQKLLKKESDVGMLLTGVQSTETSCM